MLSVELGGLNKFDDKRTITYRFLILVFTVVGIILVNYRNERYDIKLIDENTISITLENSDIQKEITLADLDYIDQKEWDTIIKELRRYNYLDED